MPIGTNKAKVTAALGSLITLALFGAHTMGIGTPCSDAALSPDVIMAAVMTLLSTGSTYLTPHGGTP